ncbi:MFS transporter [Paenibacillus sp. OAE614]|uniref:MFS transporter n=1 Tax=Paenibacillus sp. OAE614 TaxID=2663804 RepID=UPI00178AF1D0
MSQLISTPMSEKERVAVPQYLIISLLTIFAIGPQYFSNLAYTINQVIIQNGLDMSSNDLQLPSTLSNLAFALGVPFGPVLARRFGLKAHYLTMVFIFLCGSLINAVSTDVAALTIGKVIQGLSAGTLFLAILPVSLRSFPNKIRNTFLFMVITGLFGASAVGAYFGAVSLSLDTWRWLYVLNVASAVLCLAVGYYGLPKSEEHHGEHEPLDKTGVFLFVLTMISLVIPLCNLMQKGFTSYEVWPFLAVAVILAVLFVIVDLRAKTPLVPFRTLKAPKPISGTIMAIASHAVLIFAIAGITGFLKNNVSLSPSYLSHFFMWFFVGILITAILKTLLYDRLGAGVLGFIGSLAIIYVCLSWRNLVPTVTLPKLYFQAACLGGGVSMALVSGALGTALAGDIHKASMRSTTLHTMRNIVGAVLSPLLGWYLSRQNTMNYEQIRSHLGEFDAETKLELAQMTRKLMGSGMTAAQAQSTASYELIANTKRAAILGAYHHLFTMMLVLAVIILLASIGKIVTGKGFSLVQKPKKPLALPGPKERVTAESHS